MSLTISPIGQQAFASCRVPWNAMLDQSCHDGTSFVGIVSLHPQTTTDMKVPVRKVAVLGDCAAGDRMDIIASRGLEEGCCRSGMKFVGEGALVKCDLIEFVAVCSDASLFRSVAHKNRFKRRIGARSREDAGTVGTMGSARPNVTVGPWN